MLRIGKYLISTIIILMLVAYGIGCSTVQVTDYASLVDNLGKAGATVVESTERVTRFFFSVQGKLITVNGGDVEVFEYADAAAAEVEAELVSPDGSLVGTSLILWVTPPHFYKAGKLIVLYGGDSESVIGALEDALGSQFAGQ